MTSAEVYAARDLIEGVPAQTFRSTSRSTVARLLAEVAARLGEQEKAEAAAEKLVREAAELAAYGGTAAAEAGWNAERQHNPKVDRSTGDRDINCFADLSHKQKLNRAAFAFGVLNPGAKLGSPVPQEPCRFKAGDKVRITGPRVWCDGTTAAGGDDLSDICTVTDVLHDGDVGVSGTGASQFAYIVPSSLTLVAESRTWDSLQAVPKGVRFAEKADPAWSWKRETSATCQAYLHGKPTTIWNNVAVATNAPFIEVVA